MISFKGLMNPKSKTIYIKINDLNAKLIEILNVILVKVTPICDELPMFIVSFFIYTTSDAGRDAFMLPFPAM